MDQTNPDHDLAEDESSNIVYALSAGDPFFPGEAGTAFAGLASGLLRSTDGGQTWEDALANLHLSEPLPVTCVLIPPLDENATGAHVIAGAPGGILRSVDHGSTWQAVVFQSPPPTVAALAASPNYSEDQIIFAGTIEDGVFISRDNGLSWVAWNFGFLDLNVLCLAVSPNFREDETIIAGTGTGIFRSTNGGRAWREVELPCGLSAVLALAFSPELSQTGTIYAGTEEHGLWVSTDFGDRWRQIAAFDEPVNALQVTSHDILVVNGSGLLLSPNMGQTWITRYAGQDDESEITAVLAAQGLGSSTKVLVSFVSGEIKTIMLSS